MTESTVLIMKILDYGEIIANTFDGLKDFDPDEYDEEYLVRRFRVYLVFDDNPYFKINDGVTNKTIKIIKTLKTFRNYYLNVIHKQRTTNQLYKE